MLRCRTCLGGNGSCSRRARRAIAPERAAALAALLAVGAAASVRSARAWDRPIPHAYGRVVLDNFSRRAGVPPALAATLPRDRLGLVDWARAEAERLVRPLDRVEGLSIQRRALGVDREVSIESNAPWMRDIVFSHRKHTVWNGCEVCHPEIFPSTKGGAARRATRCCTSRTRSTAACVTTRWRSRWRTVDGATSGRCGRRRGAAENGSARPREEGPGAPSQALCGTATTPCRNCCSRGTCHRRSCTGSGAATPSP
jgi:hypothetical protein